MSSILLKFNNGVILRNEGSRARTLPVQFARCFTTLSITQYISRQ